MTTLTLDFDTGPALAKVREAVQKIANPRPLFKSIGNAMLESTKQRFASSTAPDGSKWAANTDVTIARYLGEYSGTHKKDGSLSKKGEKRVASKKPLIAKGDLRDGLNVQFTDANSVSIGSNEDHASTQQFGALALSYKDVAPWGDVPAREFLGVSAEDEKTILELAQEFLADAL